MGEWDTYLDTYLTNETLEDGNTRGAFAAALANVSDYQFYAASPSEGDAGWAKVYADPQNRQIMQEDGTEKPVMITESETLKDAITRDMKKDGPSPTGLWLGGVKYKVVRRDEAETVGDGTVVSVLATRPNNKGVHIICTEKTVICALYDEKGDEGGASTAGTCKQRALDFAAYMKGEGL